MRRLLLVLAVVAVACVAATQAWHPHRSQAISYPPGWNLISGPDGSRVRGAIELLTFQPGDTEYESFSVDAPLRGGYGYWAYFPTGGTVDLAPGTARYTVTLIPGQYAMVGNPSSLYSATVQGADDLETYDPIANTYSSVYEIPSGQGAWATAQGTIVITGIGPTEPITVAGTPSPTATTTPIPIQTQIATPSVTPTPSSPNYTARCIDLTYDSQPFGPGTCSAHGGVKALGPAATQFPSTPTSGGSQPQARCNDGAFDYSTTVGACRADGGVAYYVGLPSQQAVDTTSGITSGSEPSSIGSFGGSSGCGSRGGPGGPRLPSGKCP